MHLVRLYIATSLDGYIADDNDGIDWLFEADGEEDYGYKDFYSDVSHLIMGRNTYEQILEFDAWPYPGKPCFVFTNTSAEPDANVTFVNGDPEEVLERLRAEHPGDTWLVGGAELVDAFRLADLIDDFILSVHPILLGGGVPLFRDGFPPQALALRTARSFPSGLVQMHFRREERRLREVEPEPVEAVEAAEAGDLPDEATAPVDEPSSDLPKTPVVEIPDSYPIATEPEEVLTFWFGKSVHGGSWNAKKSMWFNCTPNLDREIDQRFGTLVRRAGEGELDRWRETAKGRLALVILLDQFRRNIFRGAPEAFAMDPRAYELAMGGVEAEQDLELHPVERVFLYMPAMHQEDLEAQKRGVALFENLAAQARGEAVGYIKECLGYAHQHRDLIERFGRFPHRNPILGRENTPEEQAHLDGGAATYGQEPETP